MDRTERDRAEAARATCSQVCGAVRAAHSPRALCERLSAVIADAGGYDSVRILLDDSIPPELDTVCLPLMASTGRVGTLVIGRLRRGKLDAETLEELEAMAAEIAVSLAAARRRAHAQPDAEDLFRSLADNVPGAVYLCRNDARYTMLYLSRAAEDLTGYPIDDFLADRRSFVELFHPDDAPAIARDVQEALKARRSFHLVYRLRHADGSWRWAEEFGQGVYDEAAQLQFLEGVIFDITDRKQFTDELLQTQKLESLGLLAGGVAHDFNNLLGAVLVNVSLARRQLGTSGDPRVERAFAAAIEATERAAQLTRRLLAYAGRAPFELQPVDLSQLIKGLRELLRTSVPKKVELAADLADDLPPVMADSAQLQQLVMNLVINGAEAIGEGPGVVRIRTRACALGPDEVAGAGGLPPPAPGRYVCLEISDSGSGMPESVRARIFDPFFSTKGTGRGLGLAGVLGIVRSCEGALHVDTAPGGGTTFRVMLPLAAAPVDSAVVPDGEPEGGTELVLVVDDEPAVREAVRATLEDYGYRVLTAENGRRAVEVFKEYRADIALVILDMTMPVMDGPETLRALRGLRADVPVLLASGYDERDSVRRRRVEGAAGFLQKPFRGDTLARRVRELLDG